MKNTRSADENVIRPGSYYGPTIFGDSPGPSLVIPEGLCFTLHQEIKLKTFTWQPTVQPGEQATPKWQTARVISEERAAGFSTTPLFTWSLEGIPDLSLTIGVTSKTLSPSNTKVYEFSVVSWLPGENAFPRLPGDWGSYPLLYDALLYSRERMLVHLVYRHLYAAKADVVQQISAALNGPNWAKATLCSLPAIPESVRAAILLNSST